MMPVDVRMLQEIRDMPLLSLCGQGCSINSPFSAIQIMSWQNALSVYDEAWSILKDHRYQDISLLLSQIDRSLFNSTWSKTVAEAKAGISEAVDDKLNRLQVGDKVAKYVKADLLGALIEKSYAIPDEEFPSFYRQLYIIYQAGHFPCGWSGGDYPRGNLLYI